MASKIELHQKVNTISKPAWFVSLDGRKVGTVRTVKGGFQYFPRHSKVGGEIFATLTEVRLSLAEPAPFVDASHVMDADGVSRRLQTPVRVF